MIILQIHVRKIKEDNAKLSIKKSERGEEYMAIGRTNAVVGAKLKIGDITQENKAGDPKFLKCDGSELFFDESAEKFNAIIDMCEKKNFTFEMLYSDILMYRAFAFKNMWIFAHMDGKIYSTSNFKDCRQTLESGELPRIQIANGMAFATKKNAQSRCYGSTDGFNWKPINIGFNITIGNITNISYNDGLWIILTEKQPNGYYTSSDGLTYVLRSAIFTSINQNIERVSFKDGLWITGVSLTSQSRVYDFHYFTSVNGMEWVERTNLFEPGTSGSLDGNSWVLNGKFVMQIYNYIHSSDDGLVWTKTGMKTGHIDYNLPIAQLVNNVLFAFKKGEMLTCKDGINWTKRESDAIGHDVTYYKGLYVFGDNVNNYEISKDGVVWYKIPKAEIEGNYFYVGSDDNCLTATISQKGFFKLKVYQNIPKYGVDGYIKVAE